MPTSHRWRRRDVTVLPRRVGRCELGIRLTPRVRYVVENYIQSIFSYKFGRQHCHIGVIGLQNDSKSLTSLSKLIAYLRRRRRVRRPSRRRRWRSVLASCTSSWRTACRDWSRSPCRGRAEPRASWTRPEQCAAGRATCPRRSRTETGRRRGRATARRDLGGVCPRSSRSVGRSPRCQRPSPVQSAPERNQEETALASQVLSVSKPNF